MKVKSNIEFLNSEAMENLATKNRRIKQKAMNTKKAIRYRLSLSNDCCISDCALFATCNKKQIIGENVKCINYIYKLSFNK
jgi:hypothetical protein